MQYWRPSRPCSYCTQFTARRRNAPGSDQISLSVEARINRIPLSDREISGFCFLVRLQDSKPPLIALLYIAFSNQYRPEPQQSPRAIWEFCAQVRVLNKRQFNLHGVKSIVSERKIPQTAWQSRRRATANFSIRFLRQMTNAAIPCQTPIAQIFQTNTGSRRPALVKGSLRCVLQASFWGRAALDRDVHAISAETPKHAFYG